MAKYYALGEHLAAVDDNTVTMDFAEVDELVEGLPPSARYNRTWWGNSQRRSQSRAWLGAGWRVDAVNLTSARVTFTRVGTSPDEGRQRRSSPSRERPASEPEAGTLEASICATWDRWGQVVLDESARLLFPEVPDEPGVYRLWLLDGHWPVGLYIGEGQSLRRRLGNYRIPGAGQPTSLRISALLVDHLGHGEIVIEAVTRAQVLHPGGWTDADLTRKSDRVLVEHAELVRARNQEHCEIHNL